jgi:hypothetical protein
MIKNGQGHSALPYFSLTSNLIQQNITHLEKGQQMAEQLDPDELVSFRELLIANSIQIDAMAMLLVEKGVITNDELSAKLKQIQMRYNGKETEPRENRC